MKIFLNTTECLRTKPCTRAICSSTASGGLPSLAASRARTPRIHQPGLGPRTGFRASLPRAAAPSRALPLCRFAALHARASARKECKCPATWAWSLLASRVASMASASFSLSRRSCAHTSANSAGHSSARSSLFHPFCPPSCRRCCAWPCSSEPALTGRLGRERKRAASSAIIASACPSSMSSFASTWNGKHRRLHSTTTWEMRSSSGIGSPPPAGAPRPEANTS
mmetsp:Transcript_63187/g.179574  ORF Transcript_63187/g.179574 Transcript_63187/m.179574 type:complete len:225 (+) Transcript_63187:561-1235(+)